MGTNRSRGEIEENASCDYLRVTPLRPECHIRLEGEIRKRVSREMAGEFHDDNQMAGRATPGKYEALATRRKRVQTFRGVIKSRYARDRDEKRFDVTSMGNRAKRRNPRGMRQRDQRPYTRTRCIEIFRTRVLFHKNDRKLFLTCVSIRRK